MNASRLPIPPRPLFDELLLRPNLRLRIGEHVVDLGALRIVTRPDHPRLTSKAAAVLVELVRHAGDTVTRDMLLGRVWADRVTTPDVLTQAIKELRRGFCDDAKPSRYIETIPKIGYRLLAPVGLIEAEPFAAGTAPVSAGNDPELVELPAQRARGTSGRRMRALTGWLSLLAIVALAIGFGASKFRAAGSPVSAWRASDIRALTSDPGAETRPAVSPDGTRVAYSQLDPAAGVDRIVLRAIGQSQSVRLTATTAMFEEMPRWSPDGSQIAFERLGNDACTVYIVPALGGPEREVGPCHNYTTHYFDWSPDGNALITAENTGGSAGSMVLTRWDLSSGAKQPLRYARTPADPDLEAHYSPDGRRLAFRRGLAPYSDLCVMPAAGGDVRQLTQLHARIRGFAWTADGGGLVFASNHEGHFTLYTVDLADAQVRPLGTGPAEYPSVARNADTVAYEIPRTTNRLASVALGVDKAVPNLLAQSTGSDGSAALSPSGDRIVFISDRSGRQQVWLYDIESTTANALSEFHDATPLAPAWSDDGKRVLVTVRGKEMQGLVEIDLASRRQHMIGRPGADVLAGNYGPEPDSYLLVVGASSRQNQFVLLEHAGAASERQTLLASGIEHMELDAARQRVYYTKNEQRGLFARDVHGGAEAVITPLIDTSLMDGWRIVDGRVWYVSTIAWKPTDLIEFDPATGSQRVLGHLDAELRDVAFSVAPSRDRIIITPLGIEDTDIGTFRIVAER